MTDWKCNRCNYTHLSNDQHKHPSKCPVCGSKQIKPYHINKPPPQPQQTPEQLYQLIKTIRKLPPNEKEALRLQLAESGIHILSASNEPLSTILPQKEAEHYLAMIKEHQFALAEIDGVIIAVSPSSPIRLHLGVSEPLLEELRKTAEPND
ncbi:MAG: hypothetical protein HYU39_03105 [Thaumarchaeota archaeon]|nr:hypothetical protein [Nitrososphaerota archaeon]